MTFAINRLFDNYYNEIDPKAVAWLRELIKQGHIAPGDVDERSIEDVTPDDLRSYTQCHFFAGIGVWSYALRRAGWPDDRPVWTGSCPCQPFSAAGKGTGADERHLWPAWFHLIGECRPNELYGEQVASADGLGWLDLVLADLDDARYASTCVDFCAAGVGSPSIRQRLYVHARRLGYTSGERLEGHWTDKGSGGRIGSPRPIATAGAFGGLANADGRDASTERQQRGREQRQQSQDDGIGGLADDDGDGRQGADIEQGNVGQAGNEREASQPRMHGAPVQRPGPVNGYWQPSDWLFCTDGYWRPVEPGTFPLAHGAPARVGRLRGYGNAINAEAASAFIVASQG